MSLEYKYFLSDFYLFPFERGRNDLGNLLSAKEVQAETHMESFVSSRILALEGLGLVSSLVWWGVTDSISLPVCHVLEATAEDSGCRYLSWVFTFLSAVAPSWTCRFYKLPTVPLITSASLTGDAGTPRASDKWRPRGTNMSIYLPLATPPRSHVYTTLDPENFPRGLQP